ncbi:YidC/Oxa1 family membrane protein insertase [Leucobacter tenebrionis]|uniref:YidC/Oxa1 family membrane protein insertase n=1 Tax=Leucobacter tenebrionis TaxID=2873270 RepID=UPI001CA7241C|nr:YidC/Oxa1 family membrane protein insertase [Leucobacter tenebrionis]QZY51531.1 YidC/Oxa1 family membrane protein insertase [Leucobacter tenebrionis]
MSIYEFPPIKILINAAYWIVTSLSEILEPVAGAYSAAVAIIVLTVVIRAILVPVGRSQVKANVMRQRLAPQIAELRRRHQKNPEVLQRKTMELYAAEKASPFAGCLPVLAQTPVLMAVYGLFILPEIDGHPNELLSHTFFGVPLDAGFIGQIGAGTVSWGSAAVFLTIMVLIAVVAQASRRLLAQPQPETASQPQSQQPAGMPDLTGMMRVLSFMPFMTAVIAAFVPLAAGLYLLTTTAWTLGERLILTRIYQPER